jgi:hypothetical protein
MQREQEDAKTRRIEGKPTQKTFASSCLPVQFSFINGLLVNAQPLPLRSTAGNT